MDAENIGSHAPYSQGASVDTPPWKSRYLKAQGNTNDQTSRKRSVEQVIHSSEDTRPLDGIKITYDNTTIIETMGLDTMVSSAAVIHELAYGRMPAATRLAGTYSGYMMRGAYLPAQLDLIV